MKKIREYFIGVLVVITIIVYGINYFSTTINERGFLGMDKVGRQIYIQTINNYISNLDSSINVTSDWESYSFIQRIWQEPMRTTFRIYKTMPKDEYAQFRIEEGFGKIIANKEVEASLELPYKEFLQNFGSEISISEDYVLNPIELQELADKAGVVTYRDLLRGFGFIKYEYYINNDLKSSIILNPNVANHIEGNISSRIGSIKNKPLKN